MDPSSVSHLYSIRRRKLTRSAQIRRRLIFSAFRPHHPQNAEPTSFAASTSKRRARSTKDGLLSPSPLPRCSCSERLSPLDLSCELFRTSYASKNTSLTIEHAHSHHLTRLELFHSFLAGRQTTMPPPPPFTPAYPILSSTMSFQVASYAFTSLLLDDQPENLRSWAPPAAAYLSSETNGANEGQQEQRKGNAIGREGQLYYIVLVRMVLLVRVGSFVAPRSEAEVQASIEDAKELLDAAAATRDGGKSGLITFGAFIAVAGPFLY